MNRQLWKRLRYGGPHWHNGQRWTFRICQECGYSGPTERVGFHDHDGVGVWMPEVTVVPARHQK